MELKRKRMLLIILVASALFMYRSWYTTATHSDTLTVGVIVGYAPFAMLNNQGDVEGFDIDIAHEIAHALKKKLVIKDMDLSGLLIALQQGKLDCVMTGLSITPERQKRIELIHYYGEPTTTVPLVFWQQIPADVTGINDLLQKPAATLCVEPGSIQEQFILAEYPHANLVHLHAINDIILNLQYGKVTAAVIDPDIYPTLQKQVPQLTALPIPLPINYQSNGVGIGINKANTTLAAQIEQIIDQLKKDGSISLFATRWFKS